MFELSEQVAKEIWVYMNEIYGFDVPIDEVAQIVYDIIRTEGW